MIISFILQDSSLTSTTNNNNNNNNNNTENNGKTNELVGHKSEMSYFVPPATQVSHEPVSSSSPKVGNTSDEDEDLLHSSTIPTDTLPESNQEKKSDDDMDHSSKIEDNADLSQVRHSALSIE